MEFRNLSKQYQSNKENIDRAIQSVLNSAHFIQGSQVKELEEKLADYVGVRHCISCANGTDALQLALMAWNIGEGDAVFVPDFTFFSSGEVVAAVGAVPIFIDVDGDTYNLDVRKLEEGIAKTLEKGRYIPRAVIAVDLFGQPADYPAIRKIADKYSLHVLEDAAQGFGGAIRNKRACSFGDIATTSFFPAKPLGCYGDGGAVFTDNDNWAQTLRSLAVHGKGGSKYDNVRIGMNSRLDTIQAAVLLAKFPVFAQQELKKGDQLAKFYSEQLENIVKVPFVKEGYYSSWAQYTIQLEDEKERKKVQDFLRDAGIPTAVYYQKPLHKQTAFVMYGYEDYEYNVSNKLCGKVLSLPFYPDMGKEEARHVVENLKGCLG